MSTHEHAVLTIEIPFGQHHKFVFLCQPMIVIFRSTYTVDDLLNAIGDLVHAAMTADPKTSALGYRVSAKANQR